MPARRSRRARHFGRTASPVRSGSRGPPRPTSSPRRRDERQGRRRPRADPRPVAFAWGKPPLPVIGAALPFLEGNVGERAFGRAHPVDEIRGRGSIGPAAETPAHLRDEEPITPRAGKWLDRISLQPFGESADIYFIMWERDNAMSGWDEPARGPGAGRVLPAPAARILRAVVACLCSALALAALPPGASAVTVSGSQTSQTLLPGRANALCFTLTISNALPITLQSVRFTNRSLGPGNQNQLDAELGQPRLYRDANGNSTFDPGTDDSLAQSSASGGSLRFSSLNVAVPALGSVTLFVVTNIPPTVRDG